MPPRTSLFRSSFDDGWPTNRRCRTAPHLRGDCGGRSVAAEGTLVPSHISSGDFTFQGGQTPRKEQAGVHTSALTQPGLSSAVPPNSLLSFSHDVVAAGNGMPPSVSPASSEKKKFWVLLAAVAVPRVH
ncbi:hypothetical protein TcG_07892 [Trypanosoma cruzi]|nr:hypothetical protein BCY84_19759 [Trypanosoma cruzi cruzi]RNF14285.1 hypothetical protein TcG_07892 [Trypanosoma cruzi]